VGFACFFNSKQPFANSPKGIEPSRFMSKILKTHPGSATSSPSALKYAAHFSWASKSSASCKEISRDPSVSMAANISTMSSKRNFSEFLEIMISPVSSSCVPDLASSKLRFTSCLSVDSVVLLFASIRLTAPSEPTLVENRRVRMGLALLGVGSAPPVTFISRAPSEATRFRMGP
jgi:hypothetical protein